MPFFVSNMFLIKNSTVDDSREPRAEYFGVLYLPRAVKPDNQENLADVTHNSSHVSLGRLSRVTDSPSGRKRHPVEALRDDSGDDDHVSEAERDALLA